MVKGTGAPVTTEEASVVTLIDETRVEELLSEKLVEGFQMTKNFCPRCSTPLVMQEPIQGRPSPKKMKNPNINVPISGVPFCVCCRAHVMTKEADLVLLQDHYSGQALQGRVLIDFEAGKKKTRSLLDDEDDDETTEATQASGHPVQPASRTTGMPRINLDLEQWNELEMIRASSSISSAPSPHKPNIDCDHDDIELISSRNKGDKKTTLPLKSNARNYAMDGPNYDASSILASVVESADKNDDNDDGVGHTWEDKTNTPKNSVIKGILKPSQKDLAGQNSPTDAPRSIPDHLSRSSSSKVVVKARSNNTVSTKTASTIDSGSRTTKDQTDDDVESQENQSARSNGTSAKRVTQKLSAGSMDSNEGYWPSFEERKAIATKVLSVKMLQGCKLVQKQCRKCSMPMTELRGKVECAVCPILKRRAAKQAQQDARMLSQETGMRQGQTIAQEKKNQFFEKAKSLTGARALSAPSTSVTHYADSNSDQNSQIPKPITRKKDPPVLETVVSNSRNSVDAEDDLQDTKATETQKVSVDIVQGIFSNDSDYKEPIVIAVDHVVRGTTFPENRITLGQKKESIDAPDETMNSRATEPEVEAPTYPENDKSESRQQSSNVRTDALTLTAGFVVPTDANHVEGHQTSLIMARDFNQPSSESNPPPSEFNQPPEFNALRATLSTVSSSSLVDEKELGQDQSSPTTKKDFNPPSREFNRPQREFNPLLTSARSRAMKKKFPIGAGALLVGCGASNVNTEGFSDPIGPAVVGDSLLSKAAARPSVPRTLVSSTAPALPKTYLKRFDSPKREGRNTGEAEATTASQSQKKGRSARPVMGIAKVTPQVAGSLSTNSTKEQLAVMGIALVTSQAVASSTTNPTKTQLTSPSRKVSKEQATSLTAYYYGSQEKVASSPAKIPKEKVVQTQLDASTSNSNNEELEESPFEPLSPAEQATQKAEGGRMIAASPDIQSYGSSKLSSVHSDSTISTKTRVFLDETGCEAYLPSGFGPDGNRKSDPNGANPADVTTRTQSIPNVVTAVDAESVELLTEKDIVPREKKSPAKIELPDTPEDQSPEDEAHGTEFGGTGKISEFLVADSVPSGEEVELSDKDVAATKPNPQTTAGGTGNEATENSILPDLHEAYSDLLEEGFEVTMSFSIDSEPSCRSRENSSGRSDEALEGPKDPATLGAEEVALSTCEIPDISSDNYQNSIRSVHSTGSAQSARSALSAEQKLSVKGLEGEIDHSQKRASLEERSSSSSCLAEHSSSRRVLLEKGATPDHSSDEYLSSNLSVHALERDIDHSPQRKPLDERSPSPGRLEEQISSRQGLPETREIPDPSSANNQNSIRSVPSTGSVQSTRLALLAEQKRSATGLEREIDHSSKRVSLEEIDNSRQRVSRHSFQHGLTFEEQETVGFSPDKLSQPSPFDQHGFSHEFYEGKGIAPLFPPSNYVVHHFTNISSHIASGQISTHFLSGQHLAEPCRTADLSSDQDTTEVSTRSSKPDLRDSTARRRFASKEIGKRMADGWILLNSACSKCATPLMADPQGENEICVCCVVRTEPEAVAIENEAAGNSRDGDTDTCQEESNLTDNEIQTDESIAPAHSDVALYQDPEPINSYTHPEADDEETSQISGMSGVDRNSTARAMWSSIAKSRSSQKKKVSDPPALLGHNVSRRGAFDCDPIARPNSPLDSPQASEQLENKEKDDRLEHIKRANQPSQGLEPESSAPRIIGRAPDPVPTEMHTQHVDTIQECTTETMTEPRSITTPAEERAATLGSGSIVPASSGADTTPAKVTANKGDVITIAIPTGFDVNNEAALRQLIVAAKLGVPLTVNTRIIDTGIVVNRHFDREPSPGMSAVSTPTDYPSNTKSPSSSKSPGRRRHFASRPSHREPSPGMSAVSTPVQYPSDRTLPSCTKPSEPHSVNRHSHRESSRGMSAVSTQMHYSSGQNPSPSPKSPDLRHAVSMYSHDAVSASTQYPSVPRSPSSTRSPDGPPTKSFTFCPPTARERLRITPESMMRPRASGGANRKSFDVIPEVSSSDIRSDAYSNRPTRSTFSALGDTSVHPCLEDEHLSVRSSCYVLDSVQTTEVDQEACSVLSARSGRSAPSARSSKSQHSHEFDDHYSVSVQGSALAPYDLSHVSNEDLVYSISSSSPNVLSSSSSKVSTSTRSHGAHPSSSKVSRYSNQFYDGSGESQASGSGESELSPIAIPSTSRLKGKQYRLIPKASSSPETIIILDDFEEVVELKKKAKNVEEKSDVQSEGDIINAKGSASVSVTSEAIDSLLQKIVETETQLTAAGNEEDSAEKRKKLHELLSRLLAAADAMEELDDHSTESTTAVEEHDEGAARE